MNSNEQSLKLIPDHEDRITKISTDSNTTPIDATCAILGWALPHFEEGGEYRLVGATVSRKETQSHSQER